MLSFRRTMTRRSAIAIVLCTMPMGPTCQRADDAPHSGKHTVPAAPVPDDDRSRLEEAGWSTRAADNRAVWVSVNRQRLAVIEKGQVIAAYPCSTAAKGIGNQEGSNQTPIGWHAITERIGDGKPWGAVFKERQYTGRVWSPDRPTGDDLVLTRILWLQGLEPGLNAGTGVDSHERFIYIHGTPEEDKLGRPASHGCVRLSNSDVIELFDLAPTGTPVLITEW